MQKNYNFEQIDLGDEAVSQSHLGVNLVATANFPSQTTLFPDLIEGLDVEYLRLPGGTITEQKLDPNTSFWNDVFDPNRFEPVLDEAGRPFETIKSMLAFAEDRNIGVHFVLPTEPLLNQGEFGSRTIDQTALEATLDRAEAILRGEYGKVRIESFEIGNEYWLQGRMTAAEYGQIANEMIPRLKQISDQILSEQETDPSWIAPKIAVQSGAGWIPGDNSTIIESLDADARAEVDSVIAHYYPKNYDDAATRLNTLKQLTEWSEQNGFNEIDYLISEWNMHNTESGEFGLTQSPVIVKAFHNMLAHNVDDATFWGTQYANLNTTLSDMSTVDGRGWPNSAELTPAGETFAGMVKSLPGLKAIKLYLEDVLENDDEVGGLHLDAFGNAGRVVMFIHSDESVDTTVKIDEAFFKQMHHIWAESMGAGVDNDATAADEGDPTDIEADATFRNYSNAMLEGNDSSIVVPAHGMVRIEISMGSEGARLFFPETTEEGKEVLGSLKGDLIWGTKHSDLINGLAGGDLVESDGGDDVVNAGWGEDLAKGGAGSDVLRGSDGTDVAFGGTGNDRIFGGNDDDHLFGGDDNDHICGEDGDDLLVSSSGDDRLFGGKGADHFVIAANGRAEISDFSLEDNDRIGFLGHFSSPEDLASKMTTIVSEDGRSDLVIDLGDGRSAVLAGQGGKEEAILDSVIDFAPEGRDALQIAESLELLSGEQISSYLRALEDDGLIDEITKLDLGTLLANTSAEAGSALMNALRPDLLDEMLESRGQAGLNAFVRDASDDDLRSFVSGLSDYSRSVIMNNISLDAQEELLFALENDEEEPDTPTDDEDGGNDFPIVPVVQAPEEEEEEDLDDLFGSSPGGACFVATAAYRDPHHPDVKWLRWFRDHHLRRFLLGRLFITFYWWIGPKLAKPVYRNKSLSRISKGLLSRLVKFIRPYFDSP